MPAVADTSTRRMIIAIDALPVCTAPLEDDEPLPLSDVALPSPADVVHDAAYVCASGSLSMMKKLALRCCQGQFSLSNLMLDTSEPEGALIVPTDAGNTSSINDGPVYDKNTIKWNLLK